MALVVAKTSRVSPARPTALLQAALADFEKILTEEQKTKYHASSIKPEASDVIFFVAEIDATNQERDRRGFARRLCTFLDATQQFTAIVDTFVSSNPTIAALVWGGIRTTMLAASNISSYFDKVTSLIMSIGKFSPTYQQFGRLYPGCTSLQDALCEYYVIIIRLCAKIVEVTNRFTITQLMSSIFQPFETDFSTFVDDLQKASEFVRLQITYASNQAAQEAAQLSKWESEESKTHRRISAKFRTDITKEQKDAQEWRLRKRLREAARLRSDVRDNLATIRYVKIWNSILKHRSPLTAKWFQQEDAYRLWRNENKSSILWCSGKMGVGKTILSSSIVEHLTASRNSTEIVSHHFCLPERPESLKSRNIVGSLTRQALDSYIESAEADELRIVQKSMLEADADDIIDIVSTRLKSDKVYVFVIDGVDECEDSEIENLLQALSKLIDHQPKNLRILCSSRPELYAKAKTFLKIEHRIVVSKDKNSEDISKYTENTILQLVHEGTLNLTDLTLVVEISEVLRGGSDGMFLWTKLFISELCEQQKDGDIRQILRDPPRGIQELFGRLRDRIQSHPAHKDVLRMLLFCGVAQRPMSEEEYCELLSLSVGQRNLDQENMIHNLAQLVEASYGLAYLDEEDATLHYVHHDIQNLLFGGHIPEFEASALDLELGLLCLTYLDFDNFKTQLTRARPQASQTVNPILFAKASLPQTKGQSVKLIQKLFSSRQQFKGLQGFDLEQKVMDVLGTSDAYQLKQQLHYHFLEYAKTYWLDHLNNITLDTDDRIWRIIHQCVEGENKIAVRPWLLVDPKMLTKDPQTLTVDEAVRWSIQRNKVAMILHSLMFEPEKLSRKVEIAILEFAATQNIPAILFALIQSTTSQTWLLDRAMAVVAKAGNPDFVDFLVAGGTSVDSRYDNVIGPTALIEVAKSGDIDMVHHLLTLGANVNAYDGIERSALHHAAERGNLKIVDRLLTAGAYVNATDEISKTPLSLATVFSHWEVVNRLIDAGADVNDQGSGSETLLHFAVKKAATDTVNRLILAGADVNAPGANFETPLCRAVERGNLEVVDRLISAGADVSRRAEAPYTLIHVAAIFGHLHIVDRLIEAGADVNTVSKGGKSPLQSARDGGHDDVVYRLKMAGAK